MGMVSKPYSEMVTRFNCDEIFITFVPENEIAKQLYLSVGFNDTGNVIKAVGDELIYSLNSKNIVQRN
jgi:diamine N-acetyltransferase